MTEPMLIAVAASFLAGSFGYILFQFWLKPMLKYGRIRRRVINALAGLGNGGEAAASPPATKDRRESLRQLAADLSACYSEQLPDWYQLLLKRRQEYPLDAAAYLMKLANTRQPGQAARQVEAVQRALTPDPSAAKPVK